MCYLCFITAITEQNLSILIADLSGYTALTEAHGAYAAADLVDEFTKIIEASLVGESYLHEQVGDEVLIISPVPEHLLSTALLLLQNSGGRALFLQVHGALHFGAVLKRNEKYFGSAINLTSRMASYAKACTFLCSEEFISQLPTNYSKSLQSLGKMEFKNVSAEKEVFEIKLSSPEMIYVDPICRMIVHNDDNSFSHPLHSDLFFCSEECLTIYLAKSSKPVD